MRPRYKVGYCLKEMSLHQSSDERRYRAWYCSTAVTNAGTLITPISRDFASTLLRHISPSSHHWRGRAIRSHKEPASHLCPKMRFVWRWGSPRWRVFAKFFHKTSKKLRKSIKNPESVIFFHFFLTFSWFHNLSKNSRRGISLVKEVVWDV